ncbi:FAD-binding protein [Methyloligella sp. 2.7D]|uniref:FAD-binding protein n=1 Tax=unclassified Methyloligella TaxID=2625955 RepID=UPI00157C8EAE|nr:FAD-binding protein [Methyloligella sp. GL2]QKP76847.1 FAD-binding protein [Methyloligella sp. GL2]
MDIRRDVKIKSWDGTWDYSPKVLVTPNTVEDLVEIITDKERFPSPVRPAGSMHSTARMNGDEGTMVDMKAMNRIIEIGKETVTVEPGISFQPLALELKKHGLQFHIMTEIGNVTLGAMATAATKDSSFPGELGQISSYVTAMRYVTPKGEIRSINEKDDPHEMFLMRSSYGLLGIVFELTIRVRPTKALWLRHRNVSLQEFRERFPQYKADGCAVMYYIFPYDKRVVVELKKDNPDETPKQEYRWKYRNRFWRKYDPLITRKIEEWAPNQKVRAFLDSVHFGLIRLGLSRLVGGDKTWPHAQIINYPRDPGLNRYIFSMWAFPQEGFFDILDAYCDFLIEYEKKTGYRTNLPSVGYSIAQDRNALFSYCWNGPSLSIDPASTGGKAWEEFLKVYNVFCSEHGGTPLFNQTPFLTHDQVHKAFGEERIAEFKAARQAADPDDRLMDDYFRDLL